MNYFKVIKEYKMSLQFSPLMWQYHDGWRWKETKTLLTYDSNGNPILIDKSKNFYHRGHCHLFLPDYDIGNKASTYAYTGKQQYHFEIKDEWGPNSNDPNQNMSVRLLGKPIWYFYYQEYWRRMYIQPYSQIDRTCKLPHNQSVVYDKYTLVEYMNNLIEDNKLLESTRVVDVDWYTDNDYYGIGFNDYCTIIRRKAARIIWGELNIKGFKKEEWSDYEIVDYITTTRTTTEKQYDDYGNEIVVTTTSNYIKDFNDFYHYRAAEFQGFVKRQEALKQFLTYHGIVFDQYKQDVEGNIYIPQKETVGHIGIKYDASKACHSLGPFREGGEFYFFNTVVNRTMPCEYWIDEDKKTRQYYLKQNDCEDTTGGGTWTFKGDNTHFIWVEDKFEEAEDCINEWELGINEYNSDTFISPYSDWKYECYNHRRRNIENDEWYNHYDGYTWAYCYNFQNAKCTKTDKFIYDVKSGWHGCNDKVLHSEMSFNNEFGDIEHENNNQEDKIVDGYYDENGWHPIEITSSSSSSENEIQYDPDMMWDNQGGWDGWYEYGEIVKCAKNRKWYKRTWKPINYNIADPYDLQTVENAPHWFYKKRQAFPNPPPWLCDDPYTKQEQNINSSSSSFIPLSSSSSEQQKHFAIRNDIYDKKEDNRIHQLHWEYCHYYNLIRYYKNSQNGRNLNYNYMEYLYKYYLPLQYKDGYYVSEQGGNYNVFYFSNIIEEFENKHYERIDIPLNWEAAIDKYVQQNGNIISIADENILFNEFISNLPIKEITIYYHVNTYDKGYVFNEYDIDDFRWYSPLYYQDYNKYLLNAGSEYETEIPQNRINSDGTYNVYEYDKVIKVPLPNPIYWVNDKNYNAQSNYIKNQRYIDGEKINDKYYYWTDHEYLTYITFNEFKTIWTPLSSDQIKKLNLEGDYPQRKNKEPEIVPYPVPTYEQTYGSSSSESLVQGELEYRLEMLQQMKTESLNEHPSTLLYSDFFPRVDKKTRQTNEARSRLNPAPPPFKLSLLEEVEQIPEFELIDPYRNGKINPIDNWKKYFNKREVYTIPRKTIVDGDCGITSPKGSPHNPYTHPREMSYSIEDGARRHYPDDKYISPIIEYQKIIRLNWERLPGNEQDEAFIQANWKTDKTCNWGDGFSITVSSPFTINEEIQSPFSDSSKITKPIGEYCHDCIKPQNQMRYHIEWYDSLEKIRKFDFPNYINIIHDFQKRHLPEEMSSSSMSEQIIEYDEYGNEVMTIIDNSHNYSLYQEDFNDYERTLELRQEKDPVSEENWSSLIEKYWKELDEEHHFSDKPIVRNRDCYGNETVENAFMKLNNGKTIWRSASTYFLPTIDNVSVTEDDDGNEVYGYIDSLGKIRKGGNVVVWNDPYKQNDGIWVEQCLGAIVKPKCVQILEDGLGYRWQQEITDTAMNSGTLKGSDVDL